MGCNPSKTQARIIKDTHIPDPLNLNNFAYWYQVFDFLDFKDLMQISPVCKVFHEHTGNMKILQKFQQHLYIENSITDCEPVKKDISIEIGQNSDAEPTPSFQSPVEGTKKHFLFSFESRRSSAHNPSDSLDNFLPSSNLRGIFIQGHDAIMEVNVNESAEFRKGIQEAIKGINDSSDFEDFKTKLWQSLQNCNVVKLQQVLRHPLASDYLNDCSVDWVKGSERMSVLGGAVCTMCYVIVKIVLEYIQVDDLHKGFISETIEGKNKVIKKITPLQLACARGITNIVKCLLAKGCAVHISGVFHNRMGLKETITDMGSPALAICVNSKLQKLHMGSGNFLTKFEPEDRDYYECSRSLLEFSANPDINTMIPMYPTPLFLAINTVRFIKLLTEYGANPNWSNAKGQTPLYMLAEKSEKLECFQALIDAGALVDPPGCRPLFVAINGKFEKSLEFLKEKGAAINGNETVPSALQVAVSGDDTRMCGIILKWPDLKIDWCYRQNGKNMFHRIAINQGNEVFDLLVSNRSEEELNLIKQALNSSCFIDPKAGDTIPLFFCLNDLRLAKKYINYGADATRINLPKCILESPIEKYAIQLLLENKTDPKAKWEGKCAVWVCHEKGRIDLLLQIVRGGGDINSENTLGMTVLHDACLKGNDSIVKILVKNGADIKKVCKRSMGAHEYCQAYYPKKSKFSQEKIEKILAKYLME